MRVFRIGMEHVHHRSRRRPDDLRCFALLLYPLLFMVFLKFAAQQTRYSLSLAGARLAVAAKVALTVEGAVSVPPALVLEVGVASLHLLAEDAVGAGVLVEVVHHDTQNVGILHFQRDPHAHNA